MNWLAKINLTVVTERLGPFKSALFLLTLIVLCLFIGYRFGNFYHNYQSTTLEQQKTRLEQIYQQQENQVARINTLEVELAVEQLASQNAQEMLKKTSLEHYQVKKELAFYEKVMAPEKEADGLVIDNLKITASQSPNHYSFQVILVQQQLKKRYAKGYVDLVVVGSLADKPSQLKLSDISTITKKELLFSFKYFQVIEGSFTLPENFVPEKMNLSAILTKSRWQKYQKLNKTLPWTIE
jgi:Tfp pilus assembly protein PilO